MTKTGPFTRETLSTKVYAWLREEILAGQLSQGERLNELNIAQELGVSVTPVREAIRILDGDGLVKYDGWKGVRVIELTESEIRQCFAVRKSLEGLALQEAAPRLSDGEKEQFMALAKQTAEADGRPPRTLFERDRAFHSFFIDKAGNRWLSEFTETLSDVLTVVRIRQFQTANINVTTHEHVDIAEAVFAGAFEEASRLLDKHIERVCEESVAIRKGSASQAPAERDGEQP